MYHHVSSVIGYASLPATWISRCHYLNIFRGDYISSSKILLHSNWSFDDEDVHRSDSKFYKIWFCGMQKFIPVKMIPSTSFSFYTLKNPRIFHQQSCTNVHKLVSLNLSQIVMPSLFNPNYIKCIPFNSNSTAVHSNWSFTALISFFFNSNKSVSDMHYKQRVSVIFK